MSQLKQRASSSFLICFFLVWPSTDCMLPTWVSLTQSIDSNAHLPGHSRTDTPRKKALPALRLSVSPVQLT